MSRSLRALLLSASALLTAGSILIHRGLRLNIGVDTESTFWDQAPGDKWIYLGGLLLLIFGSLLAAAVKVWLASRRAERGFSFSIRANSGGDRRILDHMESAAKSPDFFPSDSQPACRLEVGRKEETV